VATVALEAGLFAALGEQLVRELPVSGLTGQQSARFACYVCAASSCIVAGAVRAMVARGFHVWKGTVRLAARDERPAPAFAAVRGLRRLADLADAALLVVTSDRRCERCGCRVPLHGRGAVTVHHRTYARLGHERREDVELLCWGCHRRVDYWRHRSG
jgi:hypothetical protein